MLGNSLKVKEPSNLLSFKLNYWVQYWSGEDFAERRSSNNKSMEQWYWKYQICQKKRMLLLWLNQKDYIKERKQIILNTLSMWPMLNPRNNKSTPQHCTIIRKAKFVGTSLATSEVVSPAQGKHTVRGCIGAIPQRTATHPPHKDILNSQTIERKQLAICIVLWRGYLVEHSSS